MISAAPFVQPTGQIAVASPLKENHIPFLLPGMLHDLKDDDGVRIRPHIVQRC